MPKVLVWLREVSARHGGHSVNVGSFPLSIISQLRLSRDGKMLPICSGRSLPRSNCLLICQPSFDLLSFGMIKMLEMLQLHVSALSSSLQEHWNDCALPLRHKSSLLLCFQQTLTSSCFPRDGVGAVASLSGLSGLTPIMSSGTWMDCCPGMLLVAAGPHMTDTALGERQSHDPLFHPAR